MITMPKAVRTRRTVCDCMDGCTNTGLVECVAIESQWTCDGASYTVEVASLKRWPPQPVRFTAEGGIQNGRAA